MAADHSFKSWLRERLAGLVEPPPARPEIFPDLVETRVGTPEHRVFEELRAIEAEGLAELEAGRPRAAAATFRRQEALARQMAGRVLPEDSLEPARAGLLVGRALEQAGEPFAEVEEAAQKDAVGRASRVTSRIADRLREQGLEHERAGRLRAARALMAAAVALFTPWQEQDPTKLDVLRTYLIDVLRKLGDLAEVERQLRAELADAERRGEPRCIAARDELAYHCKAQGRWDEALALYSQSLAESLAAVEHADPESIEDDRQTVTVERMRVGEALHHLGREEEAFAELDRAEAEIVAQQGPEGPAIPTVLRLRGELYRADGREDEARALIARAEVIEAEIERREREAPPEREAPHEREAPPEDG